MRLAHLGPLLCWHNNLVPIASRLGGVENGDHRPGRCACVHNDADKDRSDELLKAAGVARVVTKHHLSVGTGHKLLDKLLLDQETFLEALLETPCRLLTSSQHSTSYLHQQQPTRMRMRATHVQCTGATYAACAL